MKAIVTTTIHEPTVALLKFLEIAERDDWLLVVVGDQKTPHASYEALTNDHPEHMVYLSPADQDRKYPELSALIGWGCIQRRNFGLIYAWQMGAEIIATVDDDNIPYDDWGKNCLVGQEVAMDSYECKEPVFDSMSVFGKPYWHRGYPIELLPERRASPARRVFVKVLVQADLWNGNPDVDAIGRIAFNPTDERFEHLDIMGDERFPFTTDTPTPFNSQNTFLHRWLFPEYFLFPHVGRMDDIWAAYHVQHQFPGSVVFSAASVFQDRNPHDLYKDLADEMLGYRYSLSVATDPDALEAILPEDTLRAWRRYRECFV